MRDVFLLRWAKLYSHQTPAEQAMEPAIAALGRPYRTQHPLWGQRVFPDFALIKDKIILEVDDASHRTTKKKREDAERTKLLNRHGWIVVRCTNEEALEDPHEVVDRLIKPLLANKGIKSPDTSYLETK